VTASNGNDVFRRERMEIKNENIYLLLGFVQLEGYWNDDFCPLIEGRSTICRYNVESHKSS
jgi:hypothetical protein